MHQAVFIAFFGTEKRVRGGFFPACRTCFSDVKQIFS